MEAVDEIAIELNSPLPDSGGNDSAALGVTAELAVSTDTTTQ